MKLVFALLVAVSLAGCAVVPAVPDPYYGYGPYNYNAYPGAYPYYGAPYYGAPYYGYFGVYGYPYGPRYYHGYYRGRGYGYRGGYHRR
ncbi:MAG: hypothetical protein ABSC19_06460 [Syntrophorhabdales bacterium]|jgi:hypothetical protein